MIFLYELIKMIRQKSVWVIWVTCLLLNVLFLNAAEQIRYSYTPEMYRNLERDLEGKTEEEAISWLGERIQVLRERLNGNATSDEGAWKYECYTRNEWDELELLEDVKKERETVWNYPVYLTGVQEDAETMQTVSIFQDDNEFSSRNIRKTASDFSKMDRVKPKYDTVRGVKMATGFLPTDAIAIVLLFGVGIFLILNEKQQGLFELICHTAKGRRELLTAKLGAMAVSEVLILTGLYAGNLLMAGYLYGFGDLGRPVQSIDAYQSSILPISVGQYLCIYFLLKFLAYFVIGLIFFFICLWFRQLSGILLSLLGIVAGNAACCYLIPDNATAFSLKYLNLFYFLRTDRLLMYYKNISLFGEPVGVLQMSLFLCCILSGVMFQANRKVFCSKRIFWKGRGRKTTKQVSDFRIPRFCFLDKFEYQKNMKQTGAIYLLILFIVFQCFRVFHYSHFEDPDEVYYRSYMQYLEGPVTEQTEMYVREENTRYEALLNREETRMTEDESARLRQELLPYRAWQKAESQYERVSKAWFSGQKMPLVYEEGYHQLMGENKRMDLIEICLMTLLFSLCFATVFSGDRSIGMDQLLRTTSRGRRDTVRAKLRVTFLWAVVIFILVYGADFLKIYRKIGMSEWYAPIRSLPMFADTTTSLKIWQYFLLLYLLRFLGMTIMLAVIWGLSWICRDSFRTVLFTLLIFMLPAVCENMRRQ